MVYVFRVLALIRKFDRAKSDEEREAIEAQIDELEEKNGELTNFQAVLLLMLTGGFKSG